MRELRQANEILRKASACFPPGGARPPLQAVKAFIDERRGAYGVEPICKVIQIAPSSYWLHAQRRDQLGLHPSSWSAGSNRSGRLTWRSMAPARCGVSSTAKASRWPAVRSNKAVPPARRRSWRNAHRGLEADLSTRSDSILPSRVLGVTVAGQRKRHARRSARPDHRFCPACDDRPHRASSLPEL